MNAKAVIAAIAVAAVVVVAAVVLTSGSGSYSSSGSLSMNYEYEDQLIIDKDAGSTIPDDGMIFCVVSYTVENNTSRDISYHQSDVSLSIGTLSYSVDYTYGHNDGSWIIESGAKHSGTYAFEVPENHGTAKFSLGVQTQIDKDLEVPPVPERAAGQVYGVLYYKLFNFLDNTIVVMTLKNVSYESTISTNPYNFELTDGVGTIGHSFDTYSAAGYKDIQYVPPGQQSESFTIIFDTPVGWDDIEDQLSIVWDGTPDRGIIVTDDITEFVTY